MNESANEKERFYRSTIFCHEDFTILQVPRLELGIVLVRSSSKMLYSKVYTRGGMLPSCRRMSIGGKDILSRPI